MPSLALFVMQLVSFRSFNAFETAFVQDIDASSCDHSSEGRERRPNAIDASNCNHSPAPIVTSQEKETSSEERVRYPNSLYR